jgi:hypothetical protein
MAAMQWRSLYRYIGEPGAVRAHHVWAYVEGLTRSDKAPTVKQHLAAICMLLRLVNRRTGGRPESGGLV